LMLIYCDKNDQHSRRQKDHALFVITKNSVQPRADKEEDKHWFFEDANDQLEDTIAFFVG
jgi:hypothetical protein